MADILDFRVKNGLLVTTTATIEGITQATSTSSGSLQVRGGVGINRDLYVGGTIFGTVTLASSATNIAGGAAMSLPYQSSANTTAFLPAGTAGFILQTNGTGSAPTWVSASGVSAGFAQTATNANNVLTTATSTNASFFVTFVDTNYTGTPNYEALYTDAGLSYNPSTDLLTLSGDIAVNGGDITTNQTTFNLINATATTLNVGSAATTMRIGAASGTLTIGNPTVVGTSASQNLYNTVATTVNAFGAGTNITIGATTGATTVRNNTTITSITEATSTATGALQVRGGVGVSRDIWIGQRLNVGSDAVVTGDVSINGGDLLTNQATFNLLNTTATTINFGGASTSMTVGANAAGFVQIRNNSDATSTATGALRVNGGVGVNRDVWIGQRLNVGSDAVVTGNAFVNGGTFGTSQATFNLVNTTATTINFGGAGTNIIIGATTGATTVRNDTTITSITAATSTATGALQVRGGVGVNRDVWIGQRLNVGSDSVISGNEFVNGGTFGTNQTTFNLLNTTATVINFGGAGTNITLGATTGATTIRNNTTLTSITAATSTATGALVVHGGIGVGGNIYLGGTLHGTVNSATNIAGGAAMSLPYQSAANTTAFLAAGTAGFILQTNGTGSAPTWVSASGVSAGSANTATNADNIRTVTRSTNASHFLTFVDSDNATNAYEALYTDPGISYNPSTDLLTLSGDIAVNGGDITSTAATFNLLNATVTTANVLGAGTNITLGATSGATTIRNNTTLTSITAATSTATGALVVRGGVGINGALHVNGSIVGTATNAITASFANEIRTVSTATAASFFLTFVNSNNGSAGYEGLYTDAGISYNPSSNDLTISGDLSVGGGDIVTSAAAFNLVNTNATTVNVAGAATTLTLGATTGATTVRNNLTIAGNLTVQGATTIVDSTVTNITDPILTLGGLSNNANPTVDDAKDKGIAFKWYDTAARFGFFGFDRSTGHLTFVPQATITNEVVSGTKGALDANLAGGTAMSLVYQSAANTTAFLSAGTSGQILQTNGTGSAPTWVNASGVSAGSATNADNIRTIQRSTNATHFLTFVDSNNASNAYEALYTTSSVVVNPATGNVGIGTSLPTVQLDISSGSTSTLRLSNSNSVLSLGQITGEISFYQADSSDGGTGVSGRIGMRSANSPFFGTFFGTVADMAFFVSGGSTGVASNNAPYEALTIRSNGNVGIGTTSPEVLLHLQNSSLSTGPILRLANNSNIINAGGTLGTIEFFTGDDSDGDSVVSSIEAIQESTSPAFNSSLLFKTGLNTERLRITSAGRVGIGTSSPLSILDVAGSDDSVFQRIRSTSTGTTNTALRIQDSTTGFTNSDGIYLGRTSANATNYLWTYESEPWVFATSDTERLRITSTGGIAFGGSTNFGSSGQILQSNGNAAPTWVNASGVSAGSATNADNIRTIQRSTNATHFLTFVDSDNASNAYEALYTDAGISYNPSTNNLTISGDLTVSGGQITTDAVSTRDKYRVWTDSTYTIGMQNSITFGAVNNDYAMTFQMSNTDNRGFWWGDSSHTVAQGAMALSTNGKLTVAHSIRLGYGEADTTVPGVNHRLDVSGSAYISGNVGVGTTTPQYRLDVNSSGAGFQASFGSTISSGSISGIHFGYSEVGNQLYRKSAIVFERSDGAFGDARGKVHILNATAGTASAVLADARLTIDTVGNIGINTTAPVNRLHVVGIFGAPATTGSAQNGIARFAQATGVGSLDVGFGDPYSWIQSRSSANYATNYALSLNPNGGNVAVGTTSTLNKFEVSGTAGQLFSVSDTFTGTIFSVNDVSGIPSIEVIDTGLVKIAQYNGQVAISTSTAVAAMGLTVNTATYITSLGIGTAASGVLGEIRATNEITAYFSSDARLKENVTVISNPIEMIKQIRGVYFDWTDEHMAHRGGEDGYFVRKHDIGVIAQEVEAVLPEVVGNREDGFKAVKYDKIVALLIEAVKEQQNSIDMLKIELAEIKKQ